MKVPDAYRKLVQVALLPGLALLFILTSCVPQQNQQESIATPATPSAMVTFPTCRICNPGSVPGVRQFLDTWNNIHLFLSFDYNIPDPSAVASHYDFVWGANPSKVAAFRASNPKMFITYYLTLNRDDGTFADSNAFHSLSYWKSVHPDWILYRCDRVTPAYLSGEPNIPFNFTDPAFIAWQIQTYAKPASTHGYDGIAADNVTLENLSGACGYYHNGTWVQRYSGEIDDPQYEADVNTWLTIMQQQLHRLPHPLALIPNLSLRPLSPTDLQAQQILQHIDGMLDEGGFTIYTNGYLTDKDWLQRIQFISSVQAMGKPYYIVNQFTTRSIDSTQVQWVLASYLMSKEHASAVYISTKQHYGGDTRFPEYTAPIGNPLDEMYFDQTLYWRDYSHGLVIANPSSTQTFSATLPPGKVYVDLYGHIVEQTVTLQPHSGMVLLDN